MFNYHPQLHLHYAEKFTRATVQNSDLKQYGPLDATNTHN
jgi:hypothetical protein